MYKIVEAKGLKMPKMIKDMFDQMNVKPANWKRSGFSMLTHQSDMYVLCCAQNLSIAPHIKEFGKRTLPAIIMAWKAKKIVDSTIRLIEQTDDSDEEDQLRRLQDACDMTPPPSRKRQRAYLPTCLDTSSKPSKRIKEISFASKTQEESTEHFCGNELQVRCFYGGIMVNV
ncbi:8302_t:CDS:2 [Ambispora gerdemannii]|uniref:8302_t:CDS:1 n=1 Tax=Ambispora gerdemannii TaxID=144530 RepID=A0A9N9FKZ8_9GLOM|nr:8302_t:CDS:2 [Ambispora gerdemannii]